MSLPPRRHRNDAWHGESSQKMAENKSAAIFRWRWMVATRIVAPNLGVSWVMMGYSHDPFRTMVFSTFLTTSSDKGVPPAIWKAPFVATETPHETRWSGVLLPQLCQPNVGRSTQCDSGWFFAKRFQGITVCAKGGFKKSGVYPSNPGFWDEPKLYFLLRKELIETPRIGDIWIKLIPIASIGLPRNGIWAQNLRSCMFQGEPLFLNHSVGGVPFFWTTPSQRAWTGQHRVATGTVDIVLVLWTLSLPGKHQNSGPQIFLE